MLHRFLHFRRDTLGCVFTLASNWVPRGGGLRGDLLGEVSGLISVFVRDANFVLDFQTLLGWKWGAPCQTMFAGLSQALSPSSSMKRQTTRLSLKPSDAPYKWTNRRRPQDPQTHTKLQLSHIGASAVEKSNFLQFNVSFQWLSSLCYFWP